jgi:hypothetical protein
MYYAVIPEKAATALMHTDVRMPRERRMRVAACVALGGLLPTPLYLLHSMRS